VNKLINSVSSHITAVMSIARAMTKRMRRTDSSAGSGRIDIKKISMPVALISTTNMLSYNAPDIATMRHASNGSTSTNLSHASSADDSDHTTRSSSSSNHSRETLTDASSVESSPTSPEPNHLSGYFPSSKAPRRAPSHSDINRKINPVASIPEVPATTSTPAIPGRALSHSKRAHERVANKRSLQNMSPPSLTPKVAVRASREHRTSLDMFSPHTTNDHPFGKELEQLSEVAEEFGGVVRNAEWDEDVAAMAKLGLGRFGVSDYLSEIQPLFSSLLDARRFAAPSAWI
jgi:hypothetical protein